LFTLSQVNHDIEGSSLLFDYATVVLKNILAGDTLSTNIEVGGNGSNLLPGDKTMEWDTNPDSDIKGYVLPTTSQLGADLIGHYNVGFAFAISQKAVATAGILRFCLCLWFLGYGFLVD
jgi:hypothetical protein